MKNEETNVSIQKKKTSVAKQGSATSLDSFIDSGTIIPFNLAHSRAPSPTKNLSNKKNQLPRKSNKSKEEKYQILSRIFERNGLRDIVSHPHTFNCLNWQKIGGWGEGGGGREEISMLTQSYATKARNSTKLSNNFHLLFHRNLGVDNR